jgi:hypothetical protein
VGLAEELAALLTGEFPRLVPVEPESESCLHGLLCVFLSLKGFHVNYTGGRAQPDLVVRRARGRVEVPVEVKLTGTARDVDRGLEQLLGYMKGTDWKTGILYVWDKSRKAAAYSRAKELGTVTKWGRTILVAAVKPKT